MTGLRWLTERPIAHRGLHGGTIVENTIAAADAAVKGNYGIECDVLLTADEEVVVFHDDTLERLTAGKGLLWEKTAAELRQIPYRAAPGHIPALSEFLSCIDGRVPVLIELKSRWDGDTRLAEKVAIIASDYAGPCALMSFDPELVTALRHIAPRLTRGIVAESFFRENEWTQFSSGRKFALTNLTHLAQTRPHFIAYGIRDLPAIAPLFARSVLGMPLFTWTVRTEADKARARRWTDQMIFEGFLP